MSWKCVDSNIFNLKIVNAEVKWHMRKTLLLLILAGLLLTTVGCGGSKSSSPAGSNTSQSVTISTPIKNTVEQYFTTYFDAEKTLGYSGMPSDILEKNENTQMIEAFREVQLIHKKTFNEGISSYNYVINYQKCSVSGNEVTVEFTVDLNFHYSDAPSVNSAISGVKYIFTLKNEGPNWVITQIDSDLDEFELFKREVQQEINLNALSKTEAINQVSKARMSRLEMMGSNSIYRVGLPSTTTTSAKALNDSTANDSYINKSVYISCKQYTYNTKSVVDYATAYYNSPQTKDSLFIILDKDCTNFVSQCVWAGYVGFDPASNKKDTFKDYVSKYVGMAYNEWFCGPFDPTYQSKKWVSNWTGVKNFFEYMVTPKKVGPNATTDFANYYDRHEITTVPASSIKVGDVIQLYYDDKDSNGQVKGYDHSIIITDKTADDYTQIFYSGHTSERLNYKLSYVFGSHKAWRRLTPAAVSYMKTY